MADELSVAVIGGGYAGMATAVTLAAGGAQVTVFERARQLGGRARGVERHDARLDNGQHILLGCYRETLRLVGQVGGDPDADFRRLPLQLTLHGHFELRAPALPAPLHLLAALLSARGLSWGERYAAARFMLAMRGRGYRLPHDQSAAALLAAQRQPPRLTRLLWEPLCIAALNTPLAQASAQVLLNVLRDSLDGHRADSDMLLPRRDLTALFPERAAGYLHTHGGALHRSRGIARIEADGLAFRLHDDQSASHRFDQVVCAASPADAVRLLADLDGATADRIRALPFQPIYTVYLRYPPGVRLPQAMLGLDGGVSQWLFDQGQLSGQDGLLAAVISAEGLHQDWSHAELAARVGDELRTRLGITAQPLWNQVIAEKRATFACRPGLARPAAATALPGLWLAGDYTEGDYPATLEGAVRSGIRAAQAVLGRRG